MKKKYKNKSSYRVIERDVNRDIRTGDNALKAFPSLNTLMDKSTDNITDETLKKIMVNPLMKKFLVGRVFNLMIKFFK